MSQDLRWVRSTMNCLSEWPIKALNEHNDIVNDGWAVTITGTPPKMDSTVDYIQSIHKRVVNTVSLLYNYEITLQRTQVSLQDRYDRDNRNNILPRNDVK